MAKKTFLLRLEEPIHAALVERAYRARQSVQQLVGGWIEDQLAIDVVHVTAAGVIDERELYAHPVYEIDPLRPWSDRAVMVELGWAEAAWIFRESLESLPEPSVTAPRSIEFRRWRAQYPAALIDPPFVSLDDQAGADVVDGRHRLRELILEAAPDAGGGGRVTVAIGRESRALLEDAARVLEAIDNVSPHDEVRGNVAALAAALSISPRSARRRLAQLEAAGVIEGIQRTPGTKGSPITYVRHRRPAPQPVSTHLR